MKRFARHILLLVLLLTVVGAKASAQDVVCDSIGVKIPYAVDSADAYFFHPNRAILHETQDSLTYLRDVVEARILWVSIVGSTSPEGRPERNAELSVARGMALLEIFGLDSLDASRIRIVPRLASWSEVADVIEAEGWRHGGSVLPIMRRSDLSERGKEWRLRQLGADIWRELDKVYLCRSRYASMVVMFERPVVAESKLDSISVVAPVEVTEVQDSVVVVEKPGEDIVTEETVEKEPVAENTEEAAMPREPWSMAVKTDALYLAAGVTNLGAEFQIGEKLSVDVPVIYSPYTIAQNWRMRFFIVQPELRYWLDRPYQGHFFGLHAHAGLYNISYEKKNRYQDDNGCWGAGLSYGYSLPLKGHWGLEFTLGAGYLRTTYDVYQNRHNGPLTQENIPYNYWGLTKAGVSVVYRIDIPRKEGRK